LLKLHGQLVYSSVAVHFTPVFPNGDAIYDTQGCRELMRLSIYR